MLSENKLRHTSIPSKPITVSWLASFALSSPTFPTFAKCILSAALDAPPHTPQIARITPARQIDARRIWDGSTGERQSKTNAISLNISADNRYILASGANAGPYFQANNIAFDFQKYFRVSSRDQRLYGDILANRPVASWETVRRTALVEDACSSPTPKPEILNRLVGNGD